MTQGENPAAIEGSVVGRDGREIVPAGRRDLSDRDAEIRAAAAAGTDVVELGARYGVSVERIRQVVRAEPKRTAGGVVRHAPGTPQHVIDKTIEDPAGVLELVREGLSEATWLRYGKAWRHYLKWCRSDGRGYTPVPASEETLINYVRSMTRIGGNDGDGFAASTIRVHLAALKRVHSFGTPANAWLGDSKTITDMVEGYERRRAKDPDKAPKRADGARGPIMRLLVDTCDPSTARGLHDRAVLLLGYYMAARRSELAGLTISQLRYTESGLEIYIGHSKTDQTGQGAWVAVPADADNPTYCAVHAVDAWLVKLESVGIESGPIFRAIRNGIIRRSSEPVSGTALENVWARAKAEAIARAKAAGDRRLEKRLKQLRLTPHSARRGFASDAREADWDVLDISRHGRWSPQSKVVYVYIEEADRWRRHRNKPVRI